jgi:predicted aldo/keto reductase-like oxidoreductase
MRFPNDKTEAIKMVRYAIDNGVNYFDTAYVYGDSEVVTGEALQDGYRKKIILTTKSPVWNIQSDADFEKYLDEELTRLKTDYIDMYLLHNLNPANWDKVKKHNGLMFLERMVEKGKIRHKGFSIHSTTDAFKDIVNTYSWEMAQIQLNILQEHYQVGIDGLKYGAEKGLGMVIMEPLLGGDIVNNTPPEVEKLIDEYAEKRSLVEWCFRWLYNIPETSVILSGTSTIEQLKDNLRIFEESKPNVMSSGDMALIKAIQDVYEKIKSITCGDCKYCMPCPQGLDIPELFRLYNHFMSFNKPVGTTLFYERNMVTFGIGADSCVNCGNCKERCPQHLAIPDLMQDIHKELIRQ